MMTSISPTPNVYQIKDKLYTELPMKKYNVFRIPYQAQQQNKKDEKEDDELVKKVYNALGIGTKIDLAA